MTPRDVLRLVRSVDAPWHTTSIFPSEMAYFLVACEAAGVGCVVETGRNYGYSTAVLAAYAVERGVRVVSIDLELSPAIARACRARLGPSTPVELVRGEAFRALPRVVRAERRQVALLVDGPKRHAAVYLSASACAAGPVRLVAHHNTMERDPWCEHFRARFPTSLRPDPQTMGTWDGYVDFRAWERELTSRATRDLEELSMLVASLPRSGPDRRYLTGPTWRQTATAHLVRGWCRCGAPAPGFPRGAFGGKGPVARRT